MLAWFDGLRDWRSFSEDFLVLVHVHVLPVLVRHERWLDVASIIPDPIVLVKDVETARRSGYREDELLRERMSAMTRALTEAGRQAELAELVAYARANLGWESPA